MRYALGLPAALALAFTALGCPNYDLDSGRFACTSSSDCRQDEECSLVKQQCCTARGKSCEKSEECCSSACHQSECVLCLPENSACSSDRQCCSNRCAHGRCDAVACKPGGAQCEANLECCSRDCSSGTCRGATEPDAGPQCAPPGADCSALACCKGDCKSNTCCLDRGNACGFGEQCCSGTCDYTALPMPICT